MFVTDYLLPVLTGVGTLIFSIIFLSRFLYIKDSYRPVYIVLAATIASVVMIFVNTLKISYVNVLSAYIILTVITNIFFKGNFTLLLGFSIIVMSINGISEDIIIFLTLILGELRIEELHVSAFYYNLVQILTLSLFIVLTLTIPKIFPRKYQYLSWREAFLILFQMVAVGAGLITTANYKAGYISIAASFGVMIIHIALLASSILIFFTFSSALHKKELEKQIELYYYQFEQMKNSQAAIGRIEHDFEKHLMALKLDLNNEQPREAEKKIDMLIGNVRLSRNIADSGNADVDAIINYKAAQAGEFGINMICDLQLPYTLNMNTTDLSIILGNAIDNAIEACSAVEPEDREVAITILYEKPNLRISISNPFTGNVKTDAGGELITTKTKGHHGIGLKSIRETVGKYDGLIDISAKDNRFTLRILLFNLQSQ
jgi:sensor histidine kinase YesM